MQMDKQDWLHMKKIFDSQPRMSQRAAPGINVEGNRVTIWEPGSNCESHADKFSQKLHLVITGLRNGDQVYVGYAHNRAREFMIGSEGLKLVGYFKIEASEMAKSDGLDCDEQDLNQLTHVVTMPVDIDKIEVNEAGKAHFQVLVERDTEFFIPSENDAVFLSEIDVISKETMDCNKLDDDDMHDPYGDAD